MKPFVKYGLLLFLVSAILTFLKYFVNREWLFDTTIGMITGTVLSILFVVLAIRADRADDGGYSLGDGLKTGFLTYAIGTFLGLILMYVLMNFIDPQLIVEAQEYTIRVTENMLEKTANIMGIDDATKAEMIAEATKASKETNPFSIGNIALSYIFSLVFGLIIALIAAAIMKRG